ncbi:hypothetical protein ATN89_23925 [Comamonas thiooxydans]|nr:hypothetical protein ATN89_23925 [Comamonas thiooxydans]
MGATVGVNHRLHFTVIQLGDRSIQHRVDQFSVGACSDRPAHHHAIDAIDHGREVDFAGGQLKRGVFVATERNARKVHRALRNVLLGSFDESDQSSSSQSLGCTLNDQRMP